MGFRKAFSVNIRSLDIGDGDDLMMLPKPIHDERVTAPDTQRDWLTRRIFTIAGRYRHGESL
jgi:hypothetical protein